MFTLGTIGNRNARQRRHPDRLALALAVVLAVSLFASAEVFSQTGTGNPLAKVFEAHGGLDHWRKQRSLTYTLNDFPLTPQVARPNRSTVDLHNRYNRIEGEGFTVGFDGKQAWSTPGPDAVGLPPRLFSLATFYFISMPFVFADPGVVLDDAGTGTFRGKTYRVVQVGYKMGIGYTSKDDYTLFIDLETHRLALIHHSLTEDPDVERVTFEFNKWQEIDDLLVPAQMTFYMGWNPDDPGDGASFTIEDVAFSTKTPDPAIYQPPANAVIDDSPAVH